MLKNIATSVECITFLKVFTHKQAILNFFTSSLDKGTKIYSSLKLYKVYNILVPIDIRFQHSDTPEAVLSS